MYLAVRAKYEQYPTHASELAETTGRIRAAPSTSNWQQLNSIVLERVRYELRQQAMLEPLVERNMYEKWCDVTDLPRDSKPVIVFLVPSKLGFKERESANESAEQNRGESTELYDTAKKILDHKVEVDVNLV